MAGGTGPEDGDGSQPARSAPYSTQSLALAMRIPGEALACAWRFRAIAQSRLHVP